eukprot:7479207-Alexandrium_andersonii.AAC.1
MPLDRSEVVGLSRFGPAQDEGAPADILHDKIEDIILQVPTGEQDQRTARDLAIRFLQLAAERPDSPIADLREQAVGGELEYDDGHIENPGEHLHRL